MSMKLLVPKTLYDGFEKGQLRAIYNAYAKNEEMLDKYEFSAALSGTLTTNLFGLEVFGSIPDGETEPRVTPTNHRLDVESEEEALKIMTFIAGTIQQVTGKEMPLTITDYSEKLDTKFPFTFDKKIELKL